MADTRFAVDRVLAVGEDVVIVWVDGHESFYPGRELRLACTCAACIGEQHLFGRATLPTRSPLVPASFQPVAVRLVGNYGLQVVWGDRHDHGIYHLKDLRAACPCEECRLSRRTAAADEASTRGGGARSGSG